MKEEINHITTPLLLYLEQWGFVYENGYAITGHNLSKSRVNT